MNTTREPTSHPRELQPPHPGHLDEWLYRQHYDLRCYEPPDDLKPFVLYTWVQRKKTTSTTTKPLEVQTGPESYLFVSERTAIIHGVCNGRFPYDPTVPGLYAGIKFRPGGLYAFWQRAMSELAGTTIPASAIFPAIDRRFMARLNTLSDTEIVKALEETLRSHHPTLDWKLQDVTDIMNLMASANPPTSVRHLAFIAGKSERTLQALFREYIGISPKWILRRKRFITALSKVEDSRTTWAALALESNYTDQSHFSKEFKSITGISPSTYRQLYKYPSTEEVRVV